MPTRKLQFRSMHRCGFGSAIFALICIRSSECVFFSQILIVFVPTRNSWTSVIMFAYSFGIQAAVVRCRDYGPWIMNENWDECKFCFLFFFGRFFWNVNEYLWIDRPNDLRLSFPIQIYPTISINGLLFIKFVFTRSECDVVFSRLLWIIENRIS